MLSPFQQNHSRPIQHGMPNSVCCPLPNKTIQDRYTMAHPILHPLLHPIYMTWLWSCTFEMSQNSTHRRTQKSLYAQPVPSQSSTCLRPRTIQLWPPTYLCEWTQDVHCDAHKQLKPFHISVAVTTSQLLNTTYHYQQRFQQLPKALQCISATKICYFHIWIPRHVTELPLHNEVPNTDIAWNTRALQDICHCLS